MCDANHIIVDPTACSIDIYVNHHANDTAITFDRMVRTHHSDMLLDSISIPIPIIEDCPCNPRYGPCMYIYITNTSLVSIDISLEKFVIEFVNEYKHTVGIGFIN